MSFMSDKFLGSTIISAKNRASIVKKVAEKLELMEGDTVMFYEDQDQPGRVYIKKG